MVSTSFGKLFVIEGNAEHEYADGEVLTELSPTHIELRQIKKARGSVYRVKTFLGFAQLRNEGPTANQIDSAVGFEYLKETYWGTVEGMSRGMPTQVHESNRAPVNIVWGMPEAANKTEVS